MGCGNGILMREIAKRSGKRTIGFDFSEAQIEIAKSHEFDGCTFVKGGIDEIIDSVAHTKGKIALICSGFLHHLSDVELHNLTTKIKKLDSKKVVIVLCEPVVFPNNQANENVCPLLSGIEGNVNSVDIFAKQLRFVQSNHAKTLEMLSEHRWWGNLPYGPSPKEKPFDVNELSSILGEGYEVDFEVVNYLGGAIHFASKCSLWKN